tara:strand:+ start:448 stop:714 length:267 start_codon:yes stop_codon:yes gene_type:complete
MAFCFECGNTLEETNNHCSSCGWNVSELFGELLNRSKIDAEGCPGCKNGCGSKKGKKKKKCCKKYKKKGKNCKKCPRVEPVLAEELTH